MRLNVFIISVSYLFRYSAEDLYENGIGRIYLDNEIVRTEPSSCWNDRSCNRVMTVCHGGEWNVTVPYDSMPAFVQAYNDGADAIKGDFRVSKDNIGVVMHSSPVEFYESINCRGKYVEEMTVQECTSCQMEITQYKFISVPELLAWADGKINTMLCVKRSVDIPRAISTLIENNATHRSFLELKVDDALLLDYYQYPGWDKVYYVVDMGNDNDVKRILEQPSALLKSRIFMLEFNDWWDWNDVDQQVVLAESAGFRTMAPTRDNAIEATIENHLRLYQIGFDVAYTYNLTNAVIARQTINEKNNITPP